MENQIITVRGKLWSKQLPDLSKSTMDLNAKTQNDQIIAKQFDEISIILRCLWIGRRLHVVFWWQREKRVVFQELIWWNLVTVMLVTSWCWQHKIGCNFWWHYSDCWRWICQNVHQHLKFVTNIFSDTSVTNINVAAWTEISKHVKANVDQWIIHGLWPNYKDKQHERDFPEYCSGRNANFRSPNGQLKPAAYINIHTRKLIILIFNKLIR